MKVCPLLSIAIAIQMAAEGCHENPNAVCIGENCMFCENRYKDHPICKISSQPCGEARAMEGMDTVEDWAARQCAAMEEERE